MMEFKIEHIDETDSTNRWLSELSGVYPDENIVVVADYQTDGHGCGSNSWESERGKNLLFSLLLHPTWLKASQQYLLSMAISNAVWQTIERYGPVAPVSIKWPNDIYMGDHKVCGILIECRLQGDSIRECIVGVGLNVNQTLFRSDAPNPTSMALEFLGEFKRDILLGELLEAFRQQLEQTSAEDIRRLYRKRLYRRKGYHTYEDKEGRFEARLLTVEDDGRLVLRDRSRHTRRYAFKEVTYVIPRS